MYAVFVVLALGCWPEPEVVVQLGWRALRRG
jgi:hypothetical protein